MVEYQDWKLRHVAATVGGRVYIADKRPFVARVLAEAGLRLKPDSERLSASALAERWT
ncbi:MAG: hypothetical protein H0T61_03125 [Actinobacteria bacterium]|nr:hypothetical protein [Actinomycetota bacterium]